MPGSSCTTCPRKRLTWGSAAVALAGWAWGAWEWHDIGREAGADAGFVFAIALGIAFTVVAAISVVLPDSQRIGALMHDEGWAKGYKAGRGSRSDMEAKFLSRVK